MPADRPYLTRRAQVLLCVVVGAWFLAFAPVLLASAAADRVRRCRGPRA